jgi:serine/threonine-protein kinase
VTADRERPDDSLETTRFADGAPEDRARDGTWGDLQLREELGRGGFGTVYRAWDPALARDVALKIMPVKAGGQGAAVLREGRMLARVRHRNVVVVYSARQLGDEVGLAMELVHGRHLSDLVREHGPMGAEEASVVGVSVCSALTAVHAAGLVHRDVKARNVMRESGGRIVLMDFGAGLDATSRATRREGGGLTGTPLYMAPELFDGGSASPASDLYSVGVLLFFLVARDFPVTGGSLENVAVAHATGRRRLLSDVRPDLPAEFVRVVERALARDRAARYRTAGELLGELVHAMPAASDEASMAGHGAAPASGTMLAWPSTDTGTGRGTRHETGVPLWHHAVSGNGFAALAAGLGALWVLGLLTSLAHNSTLRMGAFSDDTPLTWLQLGLRMIVPFLGPALLALVALFALRAALHVLPAVVPPAGPLIDRVGARLRRMAERAAARSDASAAQWLLLAQVLVLGALGWLFRDVIGAFASFADVTDPETMALLGGTRPDLYRIVLTIAITFMALAWYAVLSRPAWRAPTDRPMIAGGVAILIVLLVMLELPYRLLYHTVRPVVSFDGQCCFELGRNATERVLVYCPEADVPRIRETDTAGIRSQTNSNASIFWTFAAGDDESAEACQAQPR